MDLYNEAASISCCRSLVLHFFCSRAILPFDESNSAHFSSASFVSIDATIPCFRCCHHRRHRHCRTTRNVNLLGGRIPHDACECEGFSISEHIWLPWPLLPPPPPSRCCRSHSLTLSMPFSTSSRHHRYRPLLTSDSKSRTIRSAQFCFLLLL